MSQDIHFNLLDEAWIPCERRDGGLIELSLPAVFEEAHALRGLQGESPLVIPSLMRVLLAVLHRVFGPKREEDWKALWEKGRFEMEPVRAYLEKWRPRFNLFDKERPFYQCPGMSYGTREASTLISERSKYGAPVDLFEHRPQESPTDLSPAQAARQLIVTQNFALGGLMTRAAGEPPSAMAAPLAPGAVVLISGQTLFETLLFNLLPYDPDTHKPKGVPAHPGLDMPTWEWPELLHKKPGEKRSPHGWLDLLTWQSRRLFLLAEKQNEEIRVRHIILAGGLDLVTEHTHEPMMAFRTIEKIGLKALKFNAERVLWRDATALFRLNAKEDSIPPQACERLDERIENEWLSRERSYCLDVYGLSNDQARILLCRHERLPLPPALLLEHEVSSLQLALKAAEDTRYALHIALRAVAQSAISPGFDEQSQQGRKPRGEDLTKIVQAMGAEGAYWAALREHFERLIFDLCAPEIGPEKAILAWKQSLRRIARRGFYQGSQALGNTARVLKGRALGERKLNLQLKQILGDLSGAS